MGLYFMRFHFRNIHTMNIKQEAVNLAAHEFLRTAFGVEKTNCDTSFVVENLQYDDPDQDLIRALKNNIDAERSLYFAGNDTWKKVEDNLTHFYNISEEVAEKIIEKLNNLSKESTFNRLSRYLSDKNGDGTYAILQVKNGDAYRDFRFEALDCLECPPIVDDYDFVYSGKINTLSPAYESSLDMICEELYIKFNKARPEDYTGRSISTSDIIILRYHGNVSAFYVNPYDFIELPHFLDCYYWFGTDEEE